MLFILVKHKHLLLSITNSLILFELGGELEKATRIEQVCLTLFLTT